MLTATLHPYQDSIVDYAIERGNLLIAWEMGLGKTVVSAAIVEELLGQQAITQTMFVVPASLKFQTAAQIAKLTDVDTTTTTVVGENGAKKQIVVPTEEFCVVLGTDGPEARAEQYAQLMETRPDYVVLGYENVVNDWPQVRKIKPDCIIIDEATAIKTFRAQRTRKIKRLTAPYRYALTGTAVENGKPEEIFSIMQWVDPQVLGPFDLFDKTYIERNDFGGVQYYKHLDVLHERLKPAISRKTREDAEIKPFLPKMDEKTIDVAMTPKLRSVYKKLGKELVKLLEEAARQNFGTTFDVFAHYSGNGSDTDNPLKGMIAAHTMAIEMLLDHPSLIIASGTNWEESDRLRASGVKKKTWPGSKHCYEIWKSGLLDGLTDSPKLVKTVEEVAEILDSNPKNKVIIFSFYIGMLQILQDNLGFKSVQYHGEMSDGAKAAAVQQFTDDPECRVFLSSHAGTYGIDLYMANYLINYDQAPSSGKQDQINRRHDRVISKFKNIFVLNMITEGTIETRKFARNKQKRRVASAILDGVGSTSGEVRNDVDSLTKSLLLTTS